MVRIKKSKNIILASASPLRRQLLESVSFQFDVIISPYDEDQHKERISDRSVDQQALYLASGKALAVSTLHPDHLVIAADQIGEHKGAPLFKPGNRTNAIEMLMGLQGGKHYQHCAACIYVQGEKIAEFVDTVSLTMRTLSIHEITRYVDWDEPYSCCGSYRYEGLGKYLFAHVDGAYESVLGLPLLKLLNFLQDNEFVTLC